VDQVEDEDWHREIAKRGSSVLMVSVAKESVDGSQAN